MERLDSLEARDVNTRTLTDRNGSRHWPTGRVLVRVAAACEVVDRACPTQHNGVQVDAILVDQIECGETVRQRLARDFGLPVPLNTQSADRARRIIRN